MKGVFASHDFLRFGVVLLFAPITTSRHARHTNGRSWVVCSRVFAGVVSTARRGIPSAACEEQPGKDGHNACAQWGGIEGVCANIAPSSGPCIARVEGASPAPPGLKPGHSICGGRPGRGLLATTATGCILCFRHIDPCGCSACIHERDGHYLGSRVWDQRLTVLTVPHEWCGVRGQSKLQKNRARFNRPRKWY